MPHLPEKSQPLMFAKSSTAQDVFLPIPGLIIDTRTACNCLVWEKVKPDLSDNLLWPCDFTACMDCKNYSEYPLCCHSNASGHKQYEENSYNIATLYPFLRGSTNTSLLVKHASQLDIHLSTIIHPVYNVRKQFVEYNYVLQINPPSTHTPTISLRKTIAQI